ncbi:polymer-forming cytoskeletal protein [soil metagenome]
MNIPGGDFDDISVNGMLDVEGDTKCDSLKVLGICNVEGELIAASAKINGKCRISKNITSDSLKVLGKADIAGNGYFKNTDIEGSINIGGRLSSENVNIQGHLNLTGDCNCESFSSNGKFIIGGLLNSDSINIKLHNSCKVKEIGGTTINIRRGDEIKILGFMKVKFDNPNFRKGFLETDSIEGDEIFLESVKAKIVRGQNVKIGSGCEIDLLEYRGSCEIDPDSVIKEKRMITAVEV